MTRTLFLTFALAYGLVNATSLLLIRSALRTADTGVGLTAVWGQHPVRLSMGLALYVVSFAAFMASVRFFPVTLVFPVLAGAAYAAVVLGGWLVLGEGVSGMQVAGLLTVGIGIVLLQIR